MTGVRFDLIDEQIAWAEAEEAKGDMSAWNQSDWVDNAPCGTAYCIAGHVVFSHPDVEVVFPNLGYDASVGVVYFDGRPQLVADVAQEVLGLGTCCASDLFDAYNTIDDLKYIRDGIAQGEKVATRYDEDLVDYEPPPEEP